MKLKKIIAALVVGAALTAGVFADNHPYGMDIAIGPVGFEHYETRFDGWRTRTEDTHSVLEILPIKVNTYLCPWIGNHLGIYASVGFLPGLEFNYKTKTDGVKTNLDGIGFGFAAEFMAGPCFGLDLGSSSVRFQIGAPLHALIGIGFVSWDASYNRRTGRFESSADTRITWSAFGVGLTPQFRFGAGKRCSFVIGADFVFDFIYNQTWETTTAGVTVTTSPTAGADKSCRFAVTPYLGVGLNFGD